MKNCRDGSDEDGCKKFQCCDGSSVNAYRQCDGFQDCDDGSDELFCRDCKSMRARACESHPRNNHRVIFSQYLVAQVFRCMSVPTASAST